MLNRGVRRFVYEYNGNERTYEIEEDIRGELVTPAIGSLLQRHDKEWKVVHVIAPVSTNGTIPVVRVFLNDIARAKGRPLGAKRDTPTERGVA